MKNIFDQLSTSIRGRRDRKRLLRIVPSWHSLQKQFDRDTNLFRSAIEHYTSQVSNSEMALSLQTTALLSSLCKSTRPAKLLDTGSGFSSYVLRKYAKECSDGAVVYSVDDSAEWLERTREYLAGHGIDVENLYHWRVFRDREERGFNIILHDLGSIPTRIETLRDVVAMLADDGVLLLDDYHKPKLRFAAEPLLKQQGFQLISLRSFTFDSLGRYAAIAFRGMPPFQGSEVGCQTAKA